MLQALTFFNLVHFFVKERKKERKKEGKKEAVAK
jgi:hypothetical protein